MNSPFVSIIIPVYNGQSFLEKTIRSALSQDYPNEFREVIIVDNASTDNTPDIIRQFPVTYVLQAEYQNCFASCNAGAAVASGDFLAFLDADQEAAPDWLRQLVLAFTDKEIGAVGGRYVYQDEGVVGAIDVRGNHNQPGAIVNGLPTLGSSNCMYRSSVFSELGGYRKEWFSGGDFDLAWRMQTDLGLSVEYTEHAAVYEEARTFHDYLKREFRIGYGLMLLSLAYPAIRPKMLTSLARLLFRTSLGMMSIIKSCLLYPFDRRHRFFKIKCVAASVVLAWAEYLGKVQFLINRNPIFPANW